MELDAAFDPVQRDYAISVTASLSAAGLIGLSSYVLSRLANKKIADALRLFREELRQEVNRYDPLTLELYRRTISHQQLLDNTELLIDRFISQSTIFSGYRPKPSEKAVQLVDRVNSSSRQLAVSNFFSTKMVSLDNPILRCHFADVYFDQIMTAFEQLLVEGDDRLKLHQQATQSELAFDTLHLREAIIYTRMVLEPVTHQAYDMIRKDVSNIFVCQHDLHLAFQEQYRKIENLDPETSAVLARTASDAVIEGCRMTVARARLQHIDLPWHVAFELIAYPVRDRVLTRFEDNRQLLAA